MDYEQLKAQNAAAAEDAEQATQPETVDAETEAAEEDTLTLEDAGEQTQAERPEEAASESDTVEAWMQSDEQTSHAEEKKFTDADVAAARKKMQAKVQKKLDERDEKIKELEAKLHQPQAAPTTPKPKREDFYDQDDADEAYLEALADWKIENRQAKAAAEQAAAKKQLEQAQRAKEIESSVNQHYVRAEKLAEKSGISAEAFQNAEYQVRAAVDSVFPEGGDAITDALISQIGEGSEKVLFNLGVNKQRRDALISKLKDDPSGIAAALFIGKLQADLSGTTKKVTNAPKPAPQVSGDEKVGDASAMLRKYQKAHKSGNAQEAFNIKRQAKAAGHNTKAWS